MKTIKELEKIYTDDFKLGYDQAKEDVLGLIDEIEEHPMSLTRFISELKARISG